MSTRSTRVLVVSALLCFFASHSPAQGPSSDLIFRALPPCRIIDTRLTAGPLIGGTNRAFFVAGTIGFVAQGGTSGGCGVPTRATSVFINFVAVTPQGAGNLRGSATPNPFPATGSILNYQALTPPLNIANGVIFPICDHSAPCDSDITILANGAGTHLVADVLGYFKPPPRLFRATGLGPDDSTDTGQIISRVLSFSKQEDSTSVRITYTDNRRVFPGTKAGRWQIRVDGASCPQGDLIYDYYVGTDALFHHSETVIGYCGGLPAGDHQIQVWVGPTPGYSLVDLFTGWLSSRWVLDAQEVP